MPKGELAQLRHSAKQHAVEALNLLPKNASSKKLYMIAKAMGGQSLSTHDAVLNFKKAAENLLSFAEDVGSQEKWDAIVAARVKDLEAELEAHEARVAAINEELADVAGSMQGDKDKLESLLESLGEDLSKAIVVAELRAAQKGYGASASSGAESSFDDGWDEVEDDEG